MTVRVRGEDKLAELARLMGDPSRVLRAAAKDCAEETLNLISAGFKSGQDPYGHAWGAPNDLQITGRLRSYAYSDVGPRGYNVHSTDEKAIWHHNPQPRPEWGGKSLPTRLQIPISALGLPRKWAQQLSESAEDAIASMYRAFVR